MEREKIIKLYNKAHRFVPASEVIEYFAHLIEQETLERAAEKLEAQHTWITNIAASALIRDMKVTSTS